MDTSRKHQIDQWVEDVLYTRLGQAMAKGRFTADDAALLTPLIHMYQAIQLENINDELSSLWRLFVDHDAGVYIKTGYEGVKINIEDEIDVNVKEKPPSGSPPKKGRQPT